MIIPADELHAAFCALIVSCTVYVWPNWGSFLTTEVEQQN